MHTERPPRANAITFRGEDHEKKEQEKCRAREKSVLKK